ncbi:hypothetical protein K431DRAFT_224429 [Polychaeton citri CBS 116435]|uniref:GID complex catalytic subunit 2 n=1 Tax=Polychaeton citri CBS 116435 TaxID=1314669 RepID=A0A9P4Q7P7_9PEZI|nr:hypothetical protein K431DRAFT_224429 [Polychaeton citri CBS 116435]
MDALLTSQATLERKGNLSKAVDDVQRIIDLLQNARDAVEGNPETAAMTMAKMKQPLKQSFDKVEEDLKDVNKGLNQYQKALKEIFSKTGTLPTAANESMEAQQGLVDRAIGMHLLREGKFGVASTFVKEVNQQHGTRKRAQEEQALQRKFAEMYHILDRLRNQHDLGPAIRWARKHSVELENRGSNLEFELSRLKFVELYTSEDIMDEDPFAGPLRAMDYARKTLSNFSSRYIKETSILVGSLAFSTDLEDSPYRSVFFNQSAWDDLAASFTRDFCSLLSLSPSSPLLTAITAGGIALPVLSKVEKIMQQTRGQWTSVNELPVETPLPPGYLFHSIFVCPVSKEQATDVNPPMMMPCGHVIAKESLEMHSRGKARMKCPYCPSESRPVDAIRVYI